MPWKSRLCGVRATNLDVYFKEQRSQNGNSGSHLTKPRQGGELNRCAPFLSPFVRVALGLFFLPVVFFAQDQSNASLDDTFQWLKEKAEAYGRYHYNNDSPAFSADVTAEFNRSACQVSWTTRDTSTSSYGVSWSAVEVKIPFPELQADRTTVAALSIGDKSGFSVKVVAKAGTPISAHATSSAMLEKNDASGDASLFVTDQDIANRMKNALMHAIKLCQEKEPF